VFGKDLKNSLNWLKTKNGKSAIIGILIMIAFSAGIFLLVNRLGANVLQKYVDDSGVWGPIVFILIHLLTILFSPFGGGGAIVVSSGAFFGFFGGFIYFAIGALLGASLNYFLAKKYGVWLIKKIIGHDNALEVEKITAQIANKNLFFLVALMSTAGFNLLCFAAGLSKMSYKKFILAVTISTAINTPIYIGVGAALVSPNGFFQLPVILLALAGLSLGVDFYRNKRSKK